MFKFDVFDNMMRYNDRTSMRYAAMVRCANNILREGSTMNNNKHIMCRRLLIMLLTLALVMTSMVSFAFAEDEPSADTTQVTEDQQIDDAEEQAALPEETIEDAVVEEDTSAADELIARAADAVGSDVEDAGEVMIEDEQSVAGTSAFALSSSAMSQFEINSKAAAKIKNYRSILIAGIDNGSRSDMMIVLCINTTNNKAKYFTVSRDAYMQLSSSQKYSIGGKVRDFCKCNRAYQQVGSGEMIKGRPYKNGGAVGLARELNRHLDLNIAEYVVMDWECVADLVDAFNANGKAPKFNVTKAMISAGISKAGISKAGNQSLNGWQAVSFLRIRKFPDKQGGGARNRETRNRAVFAAMFSLAKSMSVNTRLKVYNAVASELDTNISDSDIRAMLAAGGLLDKLSISQAVSNSSFPFKGKGLWDKDGLHKYDVPVTFGKKNKVTNTLASNVKLLHNYVFGQKKYATSGTVNGLSKKITNLAKSSLKKKQPKFLSASFKISSVTYNGQAQSPKPIIKLGGRTLREGDDYTLSGYANNIRPGRVTVKVNAAGSTYTGTKTLTYDIKPYATDGLKVSTKKKGFSASWNTQTADMSGTRVAGYQIQYSLKKNFSGAKTKSVSGTDTGSTSVGKLKAKKTYYVRVRTYVKSGKTAVYSAWSKASKVKTKK